MTIPDGRPTNYAPPSETPAPLAPPARLPRVQTPREWRDLAREFEKATPERRAAIINEVGGALPSEAVRELRAIAALFSGIVAAHDDEEHLFDE